MNALSWNICILTSRSYLALLLLGKHQFEEKKGKIHMLVVLKR